MVQCRKQRFKRVENYFTVAILYKDKQKDETNDGNEAAEPDDGLEKVSVELKPLVIKISDVAINSDAYIEGERVLNKSSAFKYVLFSSMDETNNEKSLIKKLNKTSALHIPAHKFTKQLDDRKS